MGLLDFVKTAEQIEEERRADIAAGKVPFGFPKGPSRLEDTTAKDKADAKAEAKFKKTVRELDQMHCRHCGRECVVTMRRQKDRAEVHHLHGRIGNFRFDVQFAILLCCECHERVTGRVNDRLFISQLGKYMVTVNGKSLINGRKPLKWQENAA